MTEPRHGTRMGYRDDRCKCEACKKAIALEHNVYKMRRAANGGKPLSVDKLGSVRRLQALMALGWTRRELARRAGYKGDAFALILNGRRQRLTVASAKRISDLYDELCMSHGPSSSSRIRATKKGWLPPLAWDDIDDPNERPHFDNGDNTPDPVVIDRILAGDFTLARAANRAERVEIVRRWRANGQALNELARATGWEPRRYLTNAEVAA